MGHSGKFPGAAAVTRVLERGDEYCWAGDRGGCLPNAGVLPLMMPSPQVRHHQLVGSWDHPVEDGGPLESTMIALYGWVLDADQTAELTISVRVNGILTAVTDVNIPRPDLSSAAGRSDPISGWELVLTLDQALPQSTVSVYVHRGHLDGGHLDGPDDGEQSLLGIRTFQHPRNTVAVRLGNLDHPAPHQRITGVAFQVYGWALIDGAPADQVELLLDENPPVLLRRADPRADVGHPAGAAPGSAWTCGFSDVIPTPDTEVDRPAVLRVRARGRRGTWWYAEPVPVTFAGTAGDKSPALQAMPSYPTAPAEVALVPGERIRVGVLTHSLNLGGGELYLQELLIRLAATGSFDLHVLTPVDGPLRAQLEDIGAVVHITAGYSTQQVFYPGRLTELSSLLQSWDCHVVLANTLGVFPAVDAALTIGLPVVWALHESFHLKLFTYLNWGAAGLHPEIVRRWRSTLQRSQLIFEAESTREMYHHQLDDLVTRRIHYGIDTAAIATYVRETDRTRLRARLGFSADELVLLCMGVYQERKAQLALVAAFAEVVGANPLARLVLVGRHPTSYAAAVAALVKELQLESAVKLVDIDPDTYQWYHCADILVSASDTESLPRSMLESLTFGMPVLAVDVYGIGEIVDDGLTGWLCAPRDGAALRAAMRRAVTSTAHQRQEMSARCRARAAGFDGSGYADEYALLLTQLANNGVPR